MPVPTADIEIVDMDSHYTEPADLWISRAPAKYRELVPRVRPGPDGYDHWVVNGDMDFGTLGVTVVRSDGDKEMGVITLPSFSDMSPAAYDYHERVKLLDEQGISQQIVFPNLAGFGNNRFMNIADADLRLACATIYNDAVAEMQADSGKRLFPQALVPFWDIAASIREIRRAKEIGLTGLVMCDEPEAFGFPSLDSPEWEPYWSEVEELGLAVNFHIGAGESQSGIVQGGGMATQARPRHRWSTLTRGALVATSTIGLFLNNSRIISNLIFSGLLLRHPRLRVVSVESGIGWIPFLLEAMEYQYDETMSPAERKPWGDLRPTDVFRRNLYVSFWFEQLGPTTLIPLIGEDNVMFETDFPHPTCLYPNAREHALRVLANVPETTRRKVLHDTAAKLYGLPSRG